MNVYLVRKELIPLSKKIILALYKEKILDEKIVKRIRNNLTKKNSGVLPKNLELVMAYRELLEEKKIKEYPALLELIKKRKIRTLSGIANITVLTKDLGCPGHCIYCPTEKGMPKSYLSNEPAMLRAIRNEFNSYKQVKTRLNGLLAQGHDITKIDIRTAGGTWGAIPEWYRQKFLKGIFLALNEGAGKIKEYTDEDISKLNLDDLIKGNETAKCRCVGLWVETRPDWINKEELIKLRSYGVTGVEIGIQTTNDKVNKFAKRGHGLKESIEATKMCKNIGLKVCHHLMPNLPTANLKSDLKSGIDLFENEGLRPDYLKIYPTMVIPFTELSEMIQRGELSYKSYNDEELMDLLSEIKKYVKRYCRIIRIIRDFPADEIEFGSKKSNLRQIMQRKGVKCQCIRCREIKDKDIKSSKLNVYKYKANNADEFFISIDEDNIDKIIGLCRLRLPNKNEKVFIKELDASALIRELHIYGNQESLNNNKLLQSKSQHLGFGKKLVKKAEEIAKENGYEKIAVISAIGTREYYKKLGYKLEGSYMLKYL